MMWIAVVLLAASAALHVESYGVHGRERLAHGRMLKIYLSKNCHSLVFEPAHDVGARNVYWVKGRTTSTKGHVSGTGSERRWYLDKVTYEDEGSYIQADLWDNLISTVRVVVTPRHIYEKRMLDESFYISMEGIQLYEATLVYTGEDGNVTLVRDGMIQQGNLINFGGQVKTHSYSGIEITLTNTSQGLYTLRDRKGRVVSITKMELTDHHDGNPLLALLLLLGIPAGVCCCCRKKIFKKKATMATTNQSTSDTVHLPPTGPVGPSPPYTTVPGPAGPVYYQGPGNVTGPAVHPPPASNPGQWNGPPPSPGFNPLYPPTNPAYPPAMGVPAQPPQWTGPPPGQYPPGPAAPMAYAPAAVMYSAAPPAPMSASEPVKEGNNASSPADPLLTTAPQAEAAFSPVPPGPPPSTYTLDSSEAACKFEISGTKPSGSFL